MATRFPAKITSSCISFSSSEPLGLICNEPVHVTKKRQEWLHLGYHTCKVLIELFYIGMPVVRVGRAGVRSRDYQNFLDGDGWVDYHTFLGMRLRSCARMWVAFTSA